MSFFDQQLVTGDFFQLLTVPNQGVIFEEKNHGNGNPPELEPTRISRVFSHIAHVYFKQWWLLGLWLSLS